MLGRRATEVRRITAGDGGLLKRVRLGALADAPFAFGSTFGSEAARHDEEWAERACSGANSRDRATFFAEADGQPIGIIGAYREEARPSDEIDLVSMWVAPGYRRSGVAKALVGAVVAWAFDAGVVSVGLWVTRGNEPAERLYEACGFVRTGDHQPLPSDPCKDEIRMRLLLRT